MYPVMLIPPKVDVPSCMELIARDLKRYMPGGEKIRVHDMHSGMDIELHVVLTGLFADGPARDKVAMSLGHNALLGCYWCALPG